jgi:Uma2 family endonuclease
MNRLVIPPQRAAPTTQAAEGLRRRLWTVAEVEAMVAGGIIAEDEPFEMIGGEVVPMSPKGARHENVKIEVNAHLQEIRPADLRIAQETTLRLDETAFLEPDFIVFARSVPLDRLRGSDVLLAIEIADASLAYDLGRKIGIYAAYGIAEVWVVDARRLVTRVHRALGAQGYREVFDVAVDGELAAVRRPEIRLNLASLGLVPDAGT